MLQKIREKFMPKYLSVKDIKPSLVINDDKIMKLRRDSRILIIDDDELPFVNKLKDAYEYNIRQMLDLESLDDAAAYEIILCDVNNVGHSFLPDKENGGLEMIKQLRKKYPQKYLVFFSSQMFGSSINEYYKYTDDVFNKNFDLSELSDSLDSALHKYYDPKIQWEKYRNYLQKNDVTSIDIAKIEDYYVKCINTSEDIKQKEIENLFKDKPILLNAFKEVINIASIISSVV